MKKRVSSVILISFSAVAILLLASSLSRRTTFTFNNMVSASADAFRPAATTVEKGRPYQKTTAELYIAAPVTELFTLSLQQGLHGYKGASDTWFRGRHDRWDRNYGGEGRLVVHGAAGGARRADALLKFDDILDSDRGLPPNITGEYVVNARLILSIGDPGTTDGDLNLHRIRQPWEAGMATGEQAADGESTAGYRFFREDGNYRPEDYWGNTGEYTEYPVAGVDYGPRLGQAAHPGPDNFEGGFGKNAVQVKFNVTETVKGWIDGEFENHGFFIESQRRNWANYSLYSSHWENNPEWRPKLKIEYIPPPGRLPEEAWMEAEKYGGGIRELIIAGNLCRQRADYLVGLGAPFPDQLAETLKATEEIEKQLDVIWALTVLAGYEDTAFESVKGVVAQLKASRDEIADAAAEGVQSLFRRGIFPGLLQERADAESIHLLGKVLEFSRFAVLHSPESRLQHAVLKALGNIWNDAAEYSETAVETYAMMAAVAAEGSWSLKRQTARIMRDLGMSADLRLAAEYEAWPMWRYDPARSGVGPHELSEDLHLQWVRKLSKPQRAWPSPVGRPGQT